MKQSLMKIVLLLSVSLLISSCHDRINWSVGLGLGGHGHGHGRVSGHGHGHGLSSFHMSMGHYYGVSDSHVSFFISNGWHDDDISVAFFLASHSGVGYKTIFRYRADGMSWLDITYKLKLHPDVFYYNAGGPPYGKAYGYYGKPKSKWKKMKFKDRQITDIVNTRFISESQGRTPKSVMKMRGQGKSFKSVHGSKGGSKGGKVYNGSKGGSKGGKVYKGSKGGGKSGGKDYKQDKGGKKDKEEKGRGRGRGR